MDDELEEDPIAPEDDIEETESFDNDPREGAVQEDGSYDEAPKREPLLSDGWVIFLVVFAIMLDIGDLFGLGEVFVTDALALVVDGLLLWKGISIGRFFLLELGEGIEVLDILPGYTIGVIWTVIQDRSDIVASVVKRIPKKPSKKPGAPNLSKNIGTKFQGARQRLLGDRGQRMLNRIESTRARTQGPVRTVPDGQGGSADVPPAPASLAAANGKERPLVPRPAEQQLEAGPNQLPANNNAPAYGSYEDAYNPREDLPTLDDLLKDIDVSGEHTVASK